MNMFQMSWYELCPTANIQQQTHDAQSYSPLEIWIIFNKNLCRTNTAGIQSAKPFWFDWACGLICPQPWQFIEHKVLHISKKNKNGWGIKRFSVIHFWKRTYAKWLNRVYMMLYLMNRGGISKENTPSLKISTCFGLNSYTWSLIINPFKLRQIQLQGACQ